MTINDLITFIVIITHNIIKSTKIDFECRTHFHFIRKKNS